MIYRGLLCLSQQGYNTTPATVAFFRQVARHTPQQPQPQHDVAVGAATMEQEPEPEQDPTRGGADEAANEDLQSDYQVGAI